MGKSFSGRLSCLAWVPNIVTAHSSIFSLQMMEEATRSVLKSISAIRKDPKLRQEFISGVADEVSHAFRPRKKIKPPKKQGEKRKRNYFKHVIACLSGPATTLNPTRSEWNRLFDIGLGKMWKGVTAASIPMNLLAKEFNALLLSMFPALVSTKYELCKLGGPYNNEIIRLVPETEDDPPQPGVIFTPKWSPSSLRSVIGNKAQLIIQPQENISEKSEVLNVPQVAMYNSNLMDKLVFITFFQMKDGQVSCFFCNSIVEVHEWDCHICEGIEQYVAPRNSPSPTPSEVLNSIEELRPTSPPSPPSPISSPRSSTHQMKARAPSASSSCRFLPNLNLSSGQIKARCANCRLQ